MDAGNGEIGEERGKLGGMLLRGLELYRQLLIFLDHWADDEHLPPLADELTDKAVEPLPVAFVDGEGVHLLPPRRQLVNDGHVEIAVDYEGEGARDRRCGHDEHVRLLPLADERRALTDTEAVLLVGDDEGEV